jgi:hypothetical protein
MKAYVLSRFMVVSESILVRPSIILVTCIEWSPSGGSEGYHWKILKVKLVQSDNSDSNKPNQFVVRGWTGQSLVWFCRPLVLRISDSVSLARVFCNVWHVWSLINGTLHRVHLILYSMLIVPCTPLYCSAVLVTLYLFLLKWNALLWCVECSKLTFDTSAHNTWYYIAV